MGEHRLIRILVDTLKRDKLDFHKIMLRRNGQPSLKSERRCWARRLRISDNIYNEFDSASYNDFLDATPYPYNTSND